MERTEIERGTVHSFPLGDLAGAFDAPTTRERDVLGELARGLTYAQIGAVLDISENTVRTHVRSLYQKLHACSRTEAVLRALRLGLISVGGP